MEKNESLVYINDLGIKVTNSLRLAGLFNSEHSNIRRSIRRYKAKNKAFSYRETIVDGINVYEVDVENMNLFQTSFARYTKYDWNKTFETGVLEVPDEEEEKEENKLTKEDVDELTHKNLVNLSFVVYHCCKAIASLESELKEKDKKFQDVVDKLAELNGEVTDIKEQVLQYVPKTQREYAMRLVEQLAYDTKETVANTYSRVYSKMVENGFRFPYVVSTEPKINQVEKAGALDKMIETIKSLFKK